VIAPLVEPAAAAGFMADDVVIAVDGKAVREAKAFLDAINAAAPDQEVAVTIIRGGQIEKLTLKPRS
jgi:S1-C subfamily serine protease